MGTKRNATEKAMGKGDSARDNRLLTRRGKGDGRLWHFGMTSGSGVPGTTGTCVPSPHNWEGVSGNPGLKQGLQCRLYVRDVIIPVYELDNTPAAQGLDSFQHFCVEYLGVVGDEVSLDFRRTSPHEFAERALASRHVYVLHVSFKFLDPYEAFVAMSTDRRHLVVRATTSLDHCGTLGG